MMRRTRLLATAAVSTALACGGLTLAPSAAEAAASTQSATYSCTNPTGTTVTVPATIGLTNLPDTLATGITVADAGYSVALDSNALSTLVGNANVAVNNLSAQVGGTQVTSASTDPLLSTLGNGLSGFSGTLGSFTVPSTGDLPVPTSFNLVSTVLGIPVVGSVVGTCTLNPASTSTVTVTSSNGTVTTGAAAVGKQKSAIKAHQVGTSQKVLVRVKNQTGKATGKVIAKLHNKRVGKGTLKAGKVRMKLRKLHHGLNKVKIYYRGDAISLATHKVVRVKLHH